MNNNFMLTHLIQNGSNIPMQDQKMRKSVKSTNHELELLVGTIFNETCQLLQDRNIHIGIPEEVTKVTEKASLLKYFIENLVNDREPSKELNGSAVIECRDCQNYEASLQKLEGEVRQHIRLEQQLKIFQDNQEEKLEEYKKQRKDFEKKFENSKRQLEDVKKLNNTLSEKVSRMEGEIQSLKKENRQLKRSVSNNQGLTTKRESHKESGYPYESKENKIDWVHRNISTKKDEKERKSIEKRGESGEKGWRQSNTKSNKMISIMNEKLIQEKTKDQRKKAIQSKFQFRR